MAKGKKTNKNKGNPKIKINKILIIKKFTTDCGDLVISCPKYLLGKMTQHFTDSKESEELLWVKGIVLRICGGSPSVPKIVVKPVELGNVYISNSYEGYKNSAVKLCKVSVKDFIDSTINRLYVANGE